MKRAMVLLLLAGAMASPAHAEEEPICTDRPTKANAVCTVPAGKWQLESSAVDWLRIEQGGSETETLLLGASVVKLGVSDRSDLQLAFTPYVRISTDGNRVSGFGDVTVRYKHRVTGADSPVQVALIPFVKLPTAKTGIGNGKAEGGVGTADQFHARRAGDGNARARSRPARRWRRSWPALGAGQSHQPLGLGCAKGDVRCGAVEQSQFRSRRHGEASFRRCGRRLSGEPAFPARRRCQSGPDSRHAGHRILRRSSIRF